MGHSRCLNLLEYEEAARQRLPRAIFEFISRGSQDGISHAGNREAFRQIDLVPRVLRDTSRRTSACTVLGCSWSAPFGVAPMGAMGIAAFQADLAIARACREENIPFVLSGSSLVSLERVAAENPAAWFQMYPSEDHAANAKLLNRLKASGLGTLVVTADVPVPGNRENDVRNGYSSPLRPTPRLAAGALLRPRWLLGTFARTILKEGVPHFENFPAGRAPMLGFQPVRSHRRDSLSWDWLKKVRDTWPGLLILKGILAPEDAAEAAALGVDGVMVSNHGGRQFDGAPPPVMAIPAMLPSLQGMALMADSGFRRGSDVLKAIALGSAMTFVGRPFVYAAAVGGEEEVRRAISLLKTEIDRDLALLGCQALPEVRHRLTPPVS